MKAASEIDDDDDDDGFDEADYIATLNQLKARAMHANDQIVSCTVARGAAGTRIAFMREIKERESEVERAGIANVNLLT